MRSYDKPYLSEKKYIKNQVETLSGERLASPGKRAGNRARFETRHQLSNHYRNIFGLVPEEYRLSA